MPQPTDTILTGTNIDFIEAMYARYLDNPAAVDASWAELFGSLARTGKPLVIDGWTLAPFDRTNGVAGTSATAASASAMQLQSRVNQAVSAFRLRGHLLAQLDPLGRPRKALEHFSDSGLVSDNAFSPSELDALVEPSGTFRENRVPLRRVLERLRRTYCGSIGVEFAHMFDSERRHWLRERMELIENRTDFSLEEQRQILTSLTRAEVFEATIHAKFQGQKRFSIEGGEAQLAMIDEFLEVGSRLGIKEVVLGMAHRGRLNVLCNVAGKPAEQIFSEIAGPSDPSLYLNRGDVKYHLGFSKEWMSRLGESVHVTMAFNPSHLGFVYPVVEGRIRAKQDRRGGNRLARQEVVPLVIHGDAAFSGQGLVAETLNLGSLPAYDVGGTIHLIVNNQLGYTTEPDQGRSSLYCTAQAQMLDIPIFHVNGDDVEAAVHVMRIATEYREKFNSDVVIDFVCYRKYGHNEGDEPSFTQPSMYQQIREHPSPRAIYAKALHAAGRIQASESEALRAVTAAEFTGAFEGTRGASKVKDPSHNKGVWENYVGGADAKVPDVVTGVPLPELKELLTKLATVPEGFVLHPNMMKGLITKRQAMVRGDEPLDWGAGEMLAYATLLKEGHRLRLTGQDTERGTFAHRHAILHDQLTGGTAFPLGDIAPDIAHVDNSPLSEMACLGFEYGYALDYPEALVVWEAQFGDFANNAQVMIDQFIASGEDKWYRFNGIVLLLPHGYEGAGPEHSSARLERFLQLAAEDNMQVCFPTNSAQMFHLLRRQMHRMIRKPLVVMTPKSLLRLHEAASPWEDFVTGTYRRVIVDPLDKKQAKAVTRLLLCSGKVYFDLAKRERGQLSVSIARLEQLYPFPMADLDAHLAQLPNLKEVVWVQEEPRNAGAWQFVHDTLHEAIGERGLKFRYAGRPASASPATGFYSTHQYEQRMLVEEALRK